MKHRRLFAFFLPVSLLLAGCAATPVAPGVYKDYEDLDTVEIVQMFRLKDYTRILVLPIDASAVTMPANHNSESSVAGIIKDATTHIAEKLQTKVPDRRQLKVSVAAANTDARHNPGALIFKSRFTQVDAGSQLARTFVGFGAGKTKLTMEGEFIDGGTGRALVRFSKTQTRSGGFGPYGLINFNSALLESNEDEIVDHLGELLDKFNS